MSDRVPLQPSRSAPLELLGALFVVLGIGGLIDPRYFYGAMDSTRGLFPKPVRIVSGALVAAGFGLGFFLLAVVYRVLP